MTITVRHPSGASVEFPDGTDEATMSRVMREFGAGGPARGPATTYKGIDFTKPEQDVRAAIKALPDAERKAAYDAWSDHYVGKEGGGLGVDNVVRAISRGTPVGSWLDEANAGTSQFANTLTGGRVGSDYDETLAYQRARDRKFDREHPVLSPALKFAGGLASIPATLALAPVGGAIGSVTASRAPQAAKLAAPLVSTPLRAAATTGATYGAIYGAGDGEDAASRVAGAGAGAAIGATLGPVAHKIGEKIGIARAARSEMKDADTASLAAIDRALARDGIEPSVLRDQIRLPQYGKLTPEQIADVARRSSAGESLDDIAASIGVGPKTVGDAVARFFDHNATPASLVDRARLTGTAAGENTAWTLRAGMASPGQGRAAAAEALTERQMQQAPRLADRVDDFVRAGDPQKRIETMRKAERAAYDTAYKTEQPFDIGMTLANAEAGVGGRQSSIADGVRSATRLFRSQASSSPPSVPAIGTNGAPKSTVAPLDHSPPISSLKDFQAAKLDLDQMIASSMNGPMPTPMTRELQRLKVGLMQDVSARNPAWREANDLFAENAVAKRLFSDMQTTGFRMTPESRQELINLAQANKVLQSRASAAEKATAQARIDMARDGLAEAVKSMLMNSRETGDHVAKLLTPAGRTYINAILGPKDGAAFMRALMAEDSITRTYRGLGGSQTTPLREAIDELNGPPLITSALDMMNPKALVQALIAKGAAKLSESRNNRMVPMMVDADPFKQLTLLKDLEAMRLVRTRGGRNAVTYGAPSVNAFVPAVPPDTYSGQRR